MHNFDFGFTGIGINQILWLYFGMSLRKSIYSFTLLNTHARYIWNDQCGLNVIIKPFKYQLAKKRNRILRLPEPRFVNNILFDIIFFVVEYLKLTLLYKWIWWQLILQLDQNRMEGQVCNLLCVDVMIGLERFVIIYVRVISV